MSVTKKKLKSLVIVESPAKSKTIHKILGNDYVIEASYGHVRNLPESTLGFDVNNNFKPTYVIIPEKKKVVTKLNDVAKKCEKVYLASDPDREGEAIAWHVKELLDVPDEKIFRIEFNEITPKAVKHAIENSRQIDMDKVNAQQTRMILDKLVGYKLSPVLWKQLRNKYLSAGRVQSVALRLVCEREDEINAFVPEEFWSIGVELSKDKKTFEAELVKHNNKKIEIKNEKDALKIADELSDKNTKYIVQKITDKETQRKPTAPFITSTLQREASSKLGYGVSRTMQIAQKLYEGIDLEEGAVGLITYMRTDSTRISDDARDMAKDFIVNHYGEEYYPETPNNYVKKGAKNVQDAHEAIRPSYPEKTPESLKPYLTPEQYKLYKLIWNKFMSSQMANAKVANRNIAIQAGDYELKAGTSKILFDGYLKLYTNDDKEEDLDVKIPDLKEKEELEYVKSNPKQHFTQPPPRYTEASLVKTLEEYGIGRPSTYASIITKIQTKKYVEKQEKNLVPTSLGQTVSKNLVANFKDIMDYSFTAQMEEKLDKVAENEVNWVNVLSEFYTPFIDNVKKVMETTTAINIETDEVCPNCGKKMVIRTSRYGTQFLGCSGYPECKTVAPLTKDNKIAKPETTTEKCEECGGELIIKTGPYGKYYECTKCKARKHIAKSFGIKCPKCGEGDVVQRKTKRGKIFYSCSTYPKCDFALWDMPTGDLCPECKAPLVKKVVKNETLHVCSNKDCKYKKVIEETSEE